MLPVCRPIYRSCPMPGPGCLGPIRPCLSPIWGLQKVSITICYLAGIQTWMYIVSIHCCNRFTAIDSLYKKNLLEPPWLLSFVPRHTIRRMAWSRNMAATMNKFMVAALSLSPCYTIGSFIMAAALSLKLTHLGVFFFFIALSPGQVSLWKYFSWLQLCPLILTHYWKVFFVAASFPPEHKSIGSVMATALFPYLK